MLRKNMIHRFIVMYVVISMLGVQSYPAMATFQQTIISFQEQLFSALFTPPAVYIPQEPLTIADRLYPVQDQFPVDIQASMTPTPTPTIITTPTPAPTQATPTPTPVPGVLRVNAARIADMEGPIDNPQYIVGGKDYTAEDPKEAVMYNNSCLVVSFDGVITAPAQVYLWMRGLFYRGPANMATLFVQYSDKILSCEDSRWNNFPLMSSINGTQFPHWTWSVINGHLPRQIWFPGVINMPLTEVRSVRLTVTGLFAPVDSVTVYGGSFTYEPFLGLEPTVSDDKCSDCMNSDAYGQAQEQVGLPIDVNSGVYTYGTDDISIQGLIEPIVFRRTYVNGTNLSEFHRSSTGTFGAGWSHNYHSRMFTYLNLESTLDMAKNNVSLGGNQDTFVVWRQFLIRVMTYVRDFNSVNYGSSVEPIEIDDAYDKLSQVIASSNADLGPDHTDSNPLDNIYEPDIRNDLLPFALEVKPFKVFITRNNAVHNLVPDGLPVNGVQKWKFVSGFLAEVESYPNGIELIYNGTPLLGPDGTPHLIESRVILRDQTVQYYDFSGAMVAIDQLHPGTQTAFITDGTTTTPDHQVLLHPTLLAYETYLPESPYGYRLKEIKSGKHALVFTYENTNPTNNSQLRIDTISEYVDGVYEGRRVSYDYTSFDTGSTILQTSVLDNFTDLNGGNWEYKYLGIYGDPRPIDELGNKTQSNAVNSIPFIRRYPRLAVILNPLDEITENTTFCSFNLDTMSNLFMTPLQRQNNIQEARYDMVSGTTVYSPAPRSCAPGRAYRQYNGAGELTLTMNYSFRYLLPYNMVTVTDGDGHTTRYNYENGVITSIEKIINGRWVAIEQTTYGVNYRPHTQTDERGNRSIYLWDGDGENYVRETVERPGVSGIITGTNLYNDVYNRVEVRVDALNRKTNYTYHPHFPTLPTSISQEREEVLEQPSESDLIVTNYDYFDTNSAYPGMLKSMTTDDGMVTCYEYNTQLQRTKIIVNCNAQDLKYIKSNITELFYDVSGRLVATKSYYLSLNDPPNTPITPITTAIIFDNTGNTIRVIENYTGSLVTGANVIDTTLCATAPDATNNICTDYGYDMAGRLITKTDPYVLDNGANGSPQLVRPVTRYTYDVAGRLIQETINHVDGLFNSADPDRDIWTQYQYDVRGNVTHVHIPTDTGIRTDRMCYDAQNRVTVHVQNYVGTINPCTSTVALTTGTNFDNNLVTRYLYNPTPDILQIITDPLGRRTAYCGDVLNRVTRVIQNVNGSILNLCNPVLTQRDGLNPDKNLITDLVYDNNSNLMTSVNPLGVTTRYYYDQFNRVVAEVVNPTGVTVTGNVTHDFDYVNDAQRTQNVITKYYYDDAGNLEAVVDAKARLTWMCYDDLNRNTRIVTNLYLANEHSFDFDTNTNYYNEVGYGQTGLRNVACDTQLTLSSPPDANIITTITYSTLGYPEFVTNDMGQTVKAEYDSLGRTTRVIESYVDGAGSPSEIATDVTTQFSYDQHGNLVRITTPDTLVTVYQYDLMNRQTKIIANSSAEQAPDTNITQTIAYDAIGRAKQVTNALGISNSFVYDNADRLITATDGLGFSTTYQYDVAGRLIRAVSPLGYTVGYTYDLANRQVSVTSPLGFVTRANYDIGGRVTQQIDANGRVTKFDYDLFGRLTDTIENFIGVENKTATTNIESLYQYDVVGNLEKVTAPNQATIEYAYDRMDRQIHFDGLGDLLDTWTTTYDQLGRATRLDAPNGTATNLSYDAMNRVIGITYDEGTSGLISTTPDVTYVYDILGRRTRMTDSATTEYDYDRMSRITAVSNITGGNIEKQVEYQYDALGRRTQLIMNNNPGVASNKVVTYEYDANNRLTSVAGWGNNTTEYDYDPGNRLTKMTLPNNLITEYGYDADNRLISSALLRPGTLQADIYSYMYNPVGLRTQTSESTYSLMNMLVPSRELQSEFTKLIADSADIIYLAPRTDLINTSLGCTEDEACFAVDFVVSVTPDADSGQTAPVQVSDWVGFKIQYQDTDTTDNQGQSLVLQAIPTNFPNSSAANANIDENLSKLVYEKIAPLVYEAYHNAFMLAFGENYDINTIVANSFDNFIDLLGANEGSYQSQSTQNISYTYDGMYRVASATYNGTGGAVNHNYAYQYDAMGSRTQQRLSINGGAEEITDFVYTNSGQISLVTVDSQPVINYIYNDVGNLEDDGFYDYQYDVANRLTNLTDGTDTFAFAYNGDGDRVSQTVGTNTIEYLLDVNSSLTQVLGEFDTDSETWYLHGLDIIAQEDIEGATSDWSYFNYDALGSVRRVFDSAGDEIGTGNMYDPFGVPIVNDIASSLGFAGEQTDDSGLVYLRARYMNPKTGAFITTDPVHGATGMSMTWNPYPYALGNPVNYTDPSGEFPWNVVIGAGAGAAMDIASQAIDNALNGKPIDCIDWNSVAWSALEGAIGALFPDGPLGMLGDFLLTMGIGMAGRGLSPEEAFGDAANGFILDLALSKMGDLVSDFIGDTGGGKSRANYTRMSDDNSSLHHKGTRYDYDKSGKQYDPNEGRYADDVDTSKSNVDADADSQAPSCPINSFTGDTLVSTAEGDKPISEIEVGDIVLAYNEETGEIGEYPVTHVWSHEDDELVTLSIDGEVIVATHDHPFYTDEGEWIEAGDLQFGDAIMSADGDFGTVDAVVITDGTAEVYNLTVDEAHTYFVGVGEWLVHNCPPDGDGGDARPDLSPVEDKLRQIFNQIKSNKDPKPKYHPTEFQCAACATDVGRTLQQAGFEVDIVKIQFHIEGRRVSLNVNNPAGGDWVIADGGWHEVVRIKHNGNEFFLDAATYFTSGQIKPLTRFEYAQLFGPDGIDADYLVYFHSHQVGSASTGFVDKFPNDIKNLLTGK